MSSCTHVTQQCPIEATLYGYRPNLAVNSFFCALFGLLLVSQVLLGCLSKNYAFTAWVTIGIFGEFLGYVGRLMMYHNPWSQPGLEIQIICLIIAPSFLAGGIYLTLKHVILRCGPHYSLLRPSIYPWVFVLCDVGSIAIQAIGGGIAAGASTGSTKALLKVGSTLIMVGIAFQVATMLVFLGLSLTFYHRRRKASRAGILCQNHILIDTERLKFKAFTCLMSGAYLCILIRCIYRLHEFAGGWGNPRMRDEPPFLILDGMMIAIACIALTIAHPKLLFPAMGTEMKMKMRAGEKDSGVHPHSRQT